MLPHLQSVIGLLALFLTIATANQPRAVKAAIYQPSDKYTYYGCYNETTGIADTSGDRALSGGTSLFGKNNMTVPVCLDFCSSNGTQYKYAGLEWSKECWCANDLEAISEKMSESNCSDPCSGNSSQICGGSLKLSVYEYSAASLGPHFSVLLLVATFLAVLVL